jgi:hypothetical protein
MNFFNKLYQLSFYFITLLVFVFGGFLQYTFGVSNTGITFLIVGITYALYFLYILVKRKIVLNWVVFFSFIYVSVIFLSAYVNGSDLLSTNVYLIFPLLPLGVFLFCFINFKENIISHNKILKLFYYIALIQLPLIFIQINFYDFFIKFNNSGQIIDWYDFMFGSFFIKSDHSLAIFLLFIILNIILNRRNFRSLLKYPRLSILYLSTTVFFTESNISKFFLIILLSTSILFPIYKKHKNSLKFQLLALLVILVLSSIGYGLKDNEIVEKRFGGSLKRQFAIETAQRQFDLGNAKRVQILILMINRIDTKWIGDGPYSYFDIRKGEFKKTKHFTQIIWTYFDLGLIGLFAIFCYVLSIIKYLDIDRGLPRWSFVAVIMVYSFYTTIFSDIAIILSLMIIFNKKANEPYYNSIS